MKMKIHEDAIRYTVRRHGSEFVEEEETIVFPCPECLSTDVREATDEDDTMSDFICNSCGCGYDACNHKKPTKAGERLSLFIKIMIGIFVAIAIILIIVGLAWLVYEKSKLGAPLPDKYVAISLAISIGGPTACMVIVSWLHYMNNIIWEG